jgi:hypothetical protein
MDRSDDGHRRDMDEREHPTPDQPPNAPGPRPKVTPILAVLGLFAVIVLVFIAITLLRYHT